MNWAAKWSELRQQIDANFRLRVGLVILAALLPLLYGSLVLKDVASAMEQEYKQATKRLQQLSNQAGQNNKWEARQKEVAVLKAELESRVWKSATPSMARAAFQDWLNTQLAQTGISNVLISMEETSSDEEVQEEKGGLKRIAAKLDFVPTSQINYNMFLQRVIDAQQHIAIETLTYNKEPAPRVEMILAVYISQESNP